jgi:ABC-type uncharacterized transport system substrate-binding protein
VALAAKAATTTIPIVFSSGTDPVQAGLVPSLSRPGGNLTGVNYMQSELGAKRLGLLHEMVPLASRFALLVNPTNSVAAESTTKDVGTAAAARGRQVDVVKAATARDIETAFGNGPGLVICADGANDQLTNAARPAGSPSGWPQAEVTIGPRGNDPADTQWNTKPWS